METKQLSTQPYAFVYSAESALARTVLFIILCLFLLGPFLFADYQPILMYSAFYPFAWIVGVGCAMSVTRYPPNAYLHAVFNLIGIAWGAFLFITMMLYQGQNTDNWNGVYNFNGLGSTPSNVTINVTASNVGPSNASFISTTVITIFFTIYCFLEWVYVVAFIIFQDEWSKLRKDEGLLTPPVPYHKTVYTDSPFNITCLVIGVTMLSLTAFQFIWNLVYFCQNVPVVVGSYFNSTVAVFIGVVLMALPLPKLQPNTYVTVTNKPLDGYYSELDPMEDKFNEIPMDITENRKYRALVTDYGFISYIGLAFGVLTITETAFWVGQNGGTVFDKDSLVNMFEGNIRLGFYNVRLIHIDAPHSVYLQMATLLKLNIIFDIVLTCLTFLALICLLHYMKLAEKLKTIEITKV